MATMKKLAPSMALALFLCLVVRLGYALSLERHPGNVPTDGYVEIAQNILAGKGFAPTPMRHWFFRTPGYPLFIAAVLSVVPPSGRYIALEVAQGALSLATCGLVYLIANAVFGRRAAFAGAVLFALSPSYTAYSMEVLSETLLIVLVALAALMAIRLSRTADVRTALGFGLVWGAAALTRPEAIVLVPLLLLPVLLARDLALTAKIQAGACAALGTVAILAPWVARNYQVYGTFVLSAPLGGNGLFAGTYPHPPLYGRGWYGTVPNAIHFTQTPEYREITRPFWDPAFVEQAAKLSDPDVVVRNERDVLEVDRRLAAAGWANVRNYKAIQVYNILIHFYDLWGRPAAWGHDWGRPIVLAWFGSYVGFLVLIVAGVVFAWRGGSLGAIPMSWLVVTAANTGLLLLFCTAPRYQASSATFLYIFGGLGVAALLPHLSPRAAAAAPPGAVAGEKAWSGS
ncbi:MAG TPA: glycosyltransferase family 39 protein [Isosphaeraceae bacterium]|nr:glycosyltransferase family 39 protein [Isosphaeraceae bacterium]